MLTKQFIIDEEKSIRDGNRQQQRANSSQTTVTDVNYDENVRVQELKHAVEIRSRTETGSDANLSAPNDESQQNSRINADELQKTDRISRRFTARRWVSNQHPADAWPQTLPSAAE
ncbi:hypothetical protein KDX27_40265 [Burkholderia cenocepacia]|uniref:hypothetical protein n=1 Tax=Burkholderia cepacia complex TaxID=87882 RepID=UPI001B9FBC41|nr:MULTISPECIES: hypothetical protein [Burkholderia cepacia complex]MBR8173922.1 hypothetical protein [Burkholderia cenocepacia]MCO8320396.1 hypothetical protein [Burkholderia multivorans]